MFDKRFIKNAIDRSAESEWDRRRFLTAAGIAGVGVGVSALTTGGASRDVAMAAASGAVTDGAVLNFALNLEYLEAEFYSQAVYGHGLPASLRTGKGKQGPVTGGHAVPFKTDRLKEIATQIAQDEKNHVSFLRTALGSAAVSEPAINIKESFTAAAMAAGLITKGQTFDPYASEENFLLGAFVFEDVGVTAYKGAAPLISNKTYLEAAAGILAVEAYHAGIIRTEILEKGLASSANKITAARDSLDGPSDLDHALTRNGGTAFLVPTHNSASIVDSRSTAQVLNIVYLNPAKVTQGGFFPAGVNGTFRESGDND
ncbi:MAG: hypothetical protein JWR33_2220 [Naasia sp.]|jgi:hypothetical protein|uniref:ferritin-like domain-containing protein n=1 Tax=Naasia sp. TaxID=2546198 RepID=UPI0026201EE1|nr:ferritin-like domain-containing protein [Naasia sp.]MCU1571479.1 hypothetical protein [Naasia sp.]